MVGIKVPVVFAAAALARTVGGLASVLIPFEIIVNVGSR